jgi:hypothetical protein
MKSSDITLSLFIIVVFIALFMVNILSVGIKNIEDNWPTYRCNPVIMPFAGMFGQDATQNFTYCIQTMQTNYMDYLLQPVHYNLDVVGNLGSFLTDSLNSVRAFLNNLRNFISDLIQNVFGVFLNILVEFQRILVELKDMVGKMSGVLATLIYTVSGSLTTMESVWAGPPGQMVKAMQGLCFHPNTKIRLYNGILCDIQDIELNSRLKNNAVVQSVMKISNINKNGHFNEELFSLKGEEDTDILVSGCHLIYDIKIDDFVHVKEWIHNNPMLGKKSNLNTDVLYCLITTNHTIPIGKWVFHDWEDNNGSLSKSL